MPMMIYSPGRITDAAQLSQTALTSPTSASLLANCSPAASHHFCSKSSWYVGNCSQRTSFKTYALATEKNVSFNSATTAPLPTLYDVLGIKHDVGLPEIKSAFRQLVRQHHPDVCSSVDPAEATTRFIQVKEAYDTLSDPHLKAAYDHHLTADASSSFSSYGVGVARNKAYKRSQTACRAQWEDQLSGLKDKSQRADWAAMQDQAKGSSWGARMRQRAQHDDSTASVNKQSVAV